MELNKYDQAGQKLEKFAEQKGLMFLELLADIRKQGAKQYSPRIRNLYKVFMMPAQPYFKHPICIKN